MRDEGEKQVSFGGVTELDIGGSKLLLSCSGKSPYLDLRISAFSTEEHYAQFADCTPGVSARPSGDTPIVRVVTSAPPDTTAFVIGWRDVLGIYPKSQHIAHIFRMQRGVDGDRTLRRLSIIAGAQMFVLAYEYGAVRIESNGVILWEQRLSISDMIESVDSASIRLVDRKSEPEVVRKAIDIETGELKMWRDSRE